MSSAASKSNETNPNLYLLAQLMAGSRTRDKKNSLEILVKFECRCRVQLMAAGTDREVLLISSDTIIRIVMNNRDSGCESRRAKPTVLTYCVPTGEDDIR